MRIVGYGLFAIISLFILAAGARVILDLQQALKGQTNQHASTGPAATAVHREAKEINDAAGAAVEGEGKC